MALPSEMLESENYGNLSAHAAKLLVDIAMQFKGTNNGDLSCPWTRMRRRGFKSKSTLWAAIAELTDAGFIVLTRQGGKHHICALYAITWKPIDECSGKLMVPAERVASNLWRQKKSSLCVRQEFAICTPEPENAQKAA